MAEPYRVGWDPEARADLLAIVAFIAEHSAIDARRVAERLLTAASSLGRHPQRCRRVPELAALPDLAGLVRGLEIRELVVRPWRVMFVIDARRVRIAAIVDSRRDAVSWLERHGARFGSPRA